MPFGLSKATVLGAAGSGGGADLAAIEKIATASISGNPNSITFTSIPQTYDDLWVTSGTEIYRWPDGSGFYVTMMEVSFNDDYSNSRRYDYTRSYGDPNPAGSPFGDRTNANAGGDIGYASDHYSSYNHTVTPQEIQVYSYTSTSKHKPYQARSTSIFEETSWIGGHLVYGMQHAQETTAITSLTIRETSGQNYWDNNAKVTLWGITRAGKA